jgi:predicted nucleic acid-binding protein
MEDYPADASTLIYIAKADAFGELAKCLRHLLAPPGVWREAVVEGERIGATEVSRIRAVENRLGTGESEVLAVGTSLGQVIIDEGRASRVARALGLIALSTLFLPILGCRSGRLPAADAVIVLRRLAAVTGARSDAVQKLEEELRREYR